MIKYKEITSNIVGYIKSKMSMIIIIALIVTLVSIVYKDKAENFTVMPDTVEEIEKPKPVAVPVLKEITPEAKKKVCDSDKNYVIEANDLLQTGNFMVLDMSTFEMFKKKRIDKNRVGYYYRRAGAVKEWYTVFKYRYPRGAQAHINSLIEYNNIIPV